jgi:hypothetical protein
MAYFGIALVMAIAVIYGMVEENSEFSKTSLVMYIWFVQLSTYIYMSSTSYWFEFYNLEILLSVVIGIFVLLVTQIIGMLVIGTSIYGGMEGFNNHMRKKRMERIGDEYGDKHAQKFLDD